MKQDLDMTVKIGAHEKPNALGKNFLSLLKRKQTDPKTNDI